VVGARGARTRQQILDSALEVFGERGLRGATVEEIARVAGLSRATLYQYFSSRDEIVAELFAECGEALLRVVRRLGPLAPTAGGYDNLHWWLGEWAYVYDKYATMFVESAHIEPAEEHLRGIVSDVLDACAARLAPRLRSAKVRGVPVDDLAKSLVTVVERCHYYRHTRPSRFSDDLVEDTLAVVVQLVLFPGTPDSAFALADDRRGPPVRRHAVRSHRAPVLLPDSEPTSLADGSKASPVRLRTLAAGAQVFANQGYRAATVDQILAQARVSRGTFYKHFRSKLDLLVTLSARARAEADTLERRFRETVAESKNGGGLRSWFVELADFQDRQSAVFRAWVELDPPHPAVMRDSEAVLRSLLGAFRAALRAHPASRRADVHPASLVILAVVERLFREDLRRRTPRERERLVDVSVAVLERGLLSLPA
jgi:AcrR family transcriptional regulator